MGKERMILRKWNDLPIYMRNEEVKEYYDILAKKKISILLKRIFDLIVGFVLLLFLIIPMCVIAIMIKLDSKGTVFYRQERITYFVIIDWTSSRSC